MEHSGTTGVAPQEDATQAAQPSADGAPQATPPQRPSRGSPGSQLARTLLDRETLEEDEAYAAAGISPGTVPAAIARGEAPGTTTAPGNPPAAAQAGADHIAPAPSR